MSVQCDHCGRELPEDEALENDRTGEIACCPRHAKILTEARA